LVSARVELARMLYPVFQKNGMDACMGLTNKKILLYWECADGGGTGETGSSPYREGDNGFLDGAGNDL